MQSKDTARQWLLANGYEEIANTIDEIMAEWKVQGKATRRNWWRVLAGDTRGNPRKVAGRTFPIIRAVRKRQALPTTEGSRSNAARELAPKTKPSGRWPDHQKHRKATKRKSLVNRSGRL
jgi:hypothetical protein